MKPEYDLAVVLGLRFGAKWRLRKDLKNRLDKAAALYREGKFETILVSGKWTIWFDWLHIHPPITEARLMKSYLQKKGIPGANILMEANSKDTIGNVYYLKLLLKDFPQYNKLLVICADQHEKRIKYLFSRFFDSRFKVTYYPVTALHYDKSSLGSEEALLREQSEFLDDLRPGHEEDIIERLYSEPYYRRQAEAVEKGLLKPQI